MKSWIGYCVEGMFIIIKMKFMFKSTIDMIMLKKRMLIESTLF